MKNLLELPGKEGDRVVALNDTRSAYNHFFRKGELVTLGKHSSDRSYPSSEWGSTDNKSGGYLIKLKDWGLVEQKEQVIGYKTPKPLYGGSVAEGTLYTRRSPHNQFYNPENAPNENSQMVPAEIVETWAPVFKEEWKVGDWVWALNSGGNGIKGEGKQVVQIADKETYSKEATGLMDYDNWDYVINQGGEYFRVNSVTAEFTRATPEEVEEATNIFAAGYKAEFTDDRVKFGCQVFTPNEVAVINTLLNKRGQNFKLSIDGTEIPRELVAKVHAKLTK